MRFDPERTAAQRARRDASAAAATRKRLIFLGFMLLLVAAAMVTAYVQQGRIRGEEEARLPESHGPDAVIALPPFDVQALAAEVHDATQTERVLADEKALALLLDHARRLTPTHFRALGARELDGEAQAELAAAPGAHRAEAYVLRGYVERLRARPRPGTGDELHGTLRLEDGSAAHFVVAQLADPSTVGSYVRIDGLFLKLARIETDEGWVEAPLFVGPRAQRSYPPLAHGDEPPRAVLATVVDDTLHDVAPEPKEAFWALMAWARELEPDAVDWGAAPVLDGQVMGEILDDGSAWRGRAVRLPVVRNQGTWIEDAGENPARIERITTGWIGSWEWQRGGVLHFVTPFAAPQIEKATTITGRGFFFRNQAYEARDGGLRVAPLFVMQSLDVYVPEEFPELQWLAWTIGGFVLLLALIFALLLRRDRRRSAELHEELVRRRRQRRGTSAAAGEPRS